MRIAYWDPLSRAWKRMTAFLFRPFDLRTWIVLAFTAWVASLLEGGGGGGGNGVRFDPSKGHHRGVTDPAQVVESLREAWAQLVGGFHWIVDRYPAALLVFVIIPLAIAVILAIVWLSSRFKLIYLDNVVHRRAAVVEPWRRLGHLGDSLFLFRIGFGLATGLVAMVIVAGFGALILATLATARVATVVLALIGSMVFLAFILGVVYANLFLNAFVVPLMHRHNLPALAAWRELLPLLSIAGGSFLLYGPFVLLLFVAAGLAIAALSLGTCCIGCLVLAIPYVGTLLLLPLHVAYRTLSLEFLAQFGPRYDLLSETSVAMPRA